MPRLPAACTACEIVYPSPLRAEGPGSDTAFAVPVPCPLCGSGGRVPAEVLRRLTGAVETLRELDAAPGELERALEAMEEVVREADDREEAVLDVLRRVPRVGRLAGLLPGEDPERMAVFVRVLRALAEGLEGERSGGGAGAGREGGTGEPALEVVSRALADLYERDAPEREEPPDERRARVRLRETGRNEPCPCGSGEKYKDCHWVEDQRETRR